MAGRHRRKTVTEGNCDHYVLCVENQTEFPNASGEDGRKLITGDNSVKSLRRNRKMCCFSDGLVAPPEDCHWRQTTRTGLWVENQAYFPDVTGVNRRKPLLETNTPLLVIEAVPE